MHELSLAGGIIDVVIQHAEGRPVKSVQLNVGTLRQVVPGTLEFYFEIVARGTACENARLEITILPARIRCRVCEDARAIDEPLFRCRACGSAEVEIVAGNEFQVESITIDAQEDDAQEEELENACT